MYGHARSSRRASPGPKKAMRGANTERSRGSRASAFLGADPVTSNPWQVLRTFKRSKREADTALTEFVTEVQRGTTRLERPATPLRVV